MSKWQIQNQPLLRVWEIYKKYTKKENPWGIYLLEQNSEGHVPRYHELMSRVWPVNTSFHSCEFAAIMITSAHGSCTTTWLTSIVKVFNCNIGNRGTVGTEEQWAKRNVSVKSWRRRNIKDMIMWQGLYIGSCVSNTIIPPGKEGKMVWTCTRRCCGEWWSKASFGYEHPI